MVHTKHIAALGTCLVALAPWIGAPSMRALANGQGTTIAGNPAPTPEQIHSLIMRAIENFRYALRLKTSQGALTPEQVQKIADAIDAAAKLIEQS